MSRKLVANSTTWLKTSIEMAEELDAADKVSKPRNSVIAIASMVEVPETSHSKVVLEDEPGKIYYIYNVHWTPTEILDAANKVAANPVAAAATAAATRTQGSIVINWGDFSQNVSEYFTVGELLNYDRNRIPRDTVSKKRLVLIAAELDKIRREWGGPLRLTSGFRPEPINSRVGGVRGSRHTFGDAVDVAPIGRSIHDFQKWVDQHWFGALGYGARRGFVHLDMRNGKGWKTGGGKAVRWTY